MAEMSRSLLLLSMSWRPNLSGEVVTRVMVQISVEVDRTTEVGDRLGKSTDNLPWYIEYLIEGAFAVLLTRSVSCKVLLNYLFAG